jgi:hypothetical protein
MWCLGSGQHRLQHSLAPPHECARHQHGNGNGNGNGNGTGTARQHEEREPDHMPINRSRPHATVRPGHRNAGSCRCGSAGGHGQRANHLFVVALQVADRSGARSRAEHGAPCRMSPRVPGHPSRILSPANTILQQPQRALSHRCHRRTRSLHPPCRSMAGAVPLPYIPPPSLMASSHGNKRKSTRTS